MYSPWTDSQQMQSQPHTPSHLFIAEMAQSEHSASHILVPRSEVRLKESQGAIQQWPHFSQPPLITVSVPSPHTTASHLRDERVREAREGRSKVEVMVSGGCVCDTSPEQLLRFTISPLHHNLRTNIGR